MKAIRIRDYGSADALELNEMPMPSPAAGQALVKVHAASVNPFDIKIREGWLKGFFPLPMPHTLGTDFAGEVVALGEGANGIGVGERVFGMLTPMHGGTYAEYLTLDTRLMRRAPANCSATDAAALPLVGVTALISVEELAQVKAGQRVLVHGGGGGVGGAAIQLAKHLGCWVAATCGPDKQDLASSLGADQVIDYTATDFRHALRDIDAVIDPIGGETNLRSYEVLRRGGTLVVVLRNDSLEMQNRERLSQQYGITVKEVAYDLRPDLLDRLRQIAEAGGIRGNVQTVLPLARAAEGQRLCETRHARGKIVLTMQ